MDTFDNVPGKEIGPSGDLPPVVQMLGASAGSAQVEIGQPVVVPDFDRTVTSDMSVYGDPLPTDRGGWDEPDPSGVGGGL